MDNTRDVRRFGASRQSIKQSGFDCGDHKQGIKSRRKVSTEDGEMGSDGEQLPPNTNNNRKRFKFSKKFFDECNSVDHASVPRKIRSAVKKRSCGSVSPPLPDMKKVKHMANGNVLPRKNGTKKSKLIMQNGEVERSPRQVVTVPITRDEEEVVETLFALAGMFSKIDESTISRLDCKLPESKSSSALAENSTHASEALKDECDLKTNDSPCLKGSTLYAKEKYSQEDNPIVLDNLETPHLNVARVSEPTGERRTCKHDRSSFSASELKLDIAMGPVQSELQPAIKKENKNGGSALWPGLSTTGFLDAEKRGPSLQPGATKLPAWMDNVGCCAKVCSSKNTVDSRVEKNSRKKTNEWKRCSAHVYISCLIKVLQLTEGKEVLGANCDELKRNERSKQEAVLDTNNNIYNNNNNNNNVVVIHENTSSSDGERRSNEVRNGGMVLEKKLVEDEYQKQVPTTSYGPYTSGNKHPSTNFISGAENRLESSFHVPPYLHCIAQNQARMPQNNGYSSSSFPHDLSAQQQQQVVCMESMVVWKQQLQRMWMDEYNSNSNSSSRRGNDVPSSGVSPSPSLLHYYAQSSFSPRPLQFVGTTTNYATATATASTISQQQEQQFISLLPLNRGAKRHRRLPQGKAAPHPMQSPPRHNPSTLPLPSL